MAHVRTVFLLAAAVLLFTSIPGEAQAYLEPGTATLVVHAVIAAMATALVFVKRSWSQIKAKLSRRKALPSELEDASS